jgi:predicted amidohydrolase
MVRVAAVQTTLFDALEKNVDHIRGCLDMLGDADFICFPGLSVSGFADHPPITIVEEALQYIGERSDGRWCIVGSYAKRDTGTFNEVYVLNREGKLAHTYQKICVSPLELGITPGEECAPLSTDAGTIGVIECFDVAATYPTSQLVHTGAQLIFCPAFWPYNALTMERKPAYNGWPTQLAKEQRVPLVFCDANHSMTVARSHILSAKGELLQVANGEQTLYADIDLTAQTPRTFLQRA